MSRNLRASTTFMLLLAAAFLPLPGFAGDGGNSSANTSVTTLAAAAGSCKNAAGGFCNEFTGSTYKAAAVQQACKGQTVTYLAGTCPAAGRVGTCLVYKGKSTESKYRYYTNFPGFGIKPAGGVAAAAESQCARLKGEWTPN